ncbi:MAG: hypothetical protein KBT57_06510 [bacterium]|nr:hypothetical protein [Candidatus Limimorpha equi]
MKSLRKLFVICLCAMSLCLTSCMGTNDTSYRGNYTETSVQLSRSNYKIIKKISAENSQTYVFGIGGFSYEAIRNNAIAELYNLADLKDNQAIINISVTTSTQLILGPIYMNRTAIATGYIIEFTD